MSFKYEKVFFLKLIFKYFIANKKHLKHQTISYTIFGEFTLSKEA